MPHKPISQRLRIVPRERDARVEARCRRAGFSALQSRIVAGRVGELDEAPERILRPRLAELHDPAMLADVGRAAQRLVQAITRGQRIGILTDYDVDGITSHAVVFEALTGFFGVPADLIQHHIGHRIKDGYGVSDALTTRILAAPQLPSVIITADCGSSDEPRLARLAEKGIDVIVTDHHEIPASGIPASAHAVVNPTRADCQFPDRTVAGCMVSWMLMCETRRQLLAGGQPGVEIPRLSGLLDFVALGTVADAVSLFGAGNRAVVQGGLRIMNRLQRPCWRALASLLDRGDGFTVQDLGFQIGPRINARGRMADPLAAMRFLLAPTDGEAREHLQQLDADNLDRRAVEAEMLAIAVEEARRQMTRGARALVVFDPTFHAGVQGIVASRLVERFGCPAVVLSPAREAGLATGSARSIAGLDIRAALQNISDAHPQMLNKFGGHKGAAGLTLSRGHLDVLRRELDRQVANLVDARLLGPRLFTDGGLDNHQFNCATVGELEALGPYGREFELPLFEGRFRIQGLRRVGGDGTHLSLVLADGEQELRGIWFRAMDSDNAPLPVAEGEILRVAYRLERDTWRGGEAVQLQVAGVESFDAK